MRAQPVNFMLGLQTIAIAAPCVTLTVPRHRSAGLHEALNDIRVREGLPSTEGRQSRGSSGEPCQRLTRGSPPCMALPLRATLVL